MGDEAVLKSVKLTQEQLGKYVKKPALTEKNLSRPPFRYLHDIVQNVIDTTGFLSGVFTPDELNAENVKSREAKTAFMQKLIQAIKDKTGDDVPIKVSKVLAGLEAEKTNGLLQSLAKAIELHNQESGGGEGATKKPSKSQSKGGGGSNKTSTSKTGATSKSDPKKKESSSGTKRTIRDPSPGSGGKPAAKQGKSNDGSGSGGKKPGSKTKLQAPPPEPEANVPEPEPNVPESLVNDETNEPEQPRAVTATKRPSTLTRKESQAKMEVAASQPEELDMDNNGGATTPTATTTGQDDQKNNINNNNANDSEQLELYDNFAASVVKPNMQTLPPPKTPILSDADAVIATMTGELPLPQPLSPKTTPLSATTPGPSLTPSPISQIAARPPTGTGPKSLSREASAENKGPYGSAAIEVRPPTGQTGQQIRSRPDTGTAGNRMSSARPPSARRAPPRPKSSVVREEAEPYRPSTGKVAHVILDNVEDPDDDNYVVREVTIAASKPPGLSDLDETPELILGGGGGGGMGGEQLDSLLPPDQRGLLVNQILETQKELEDKKGGNEDTPMIEQKLKELSLAEIEKLKNLIQICSRSANPLAKLLDYMAEDVDSMQKEYNKYREESKRLSLELDNAKTETEKFLQNLKHDLNDIERKIKDKEDAILASQMKIIQQEERIEEIVNGFERVRSGKSAAAAKEHMPGAEEILAHIQGQTSTIGGGSTFGSGGGIGPSTFSFSAVGSSTPSSAASTAPQDPFRIPDSFMVTPGLPAGPSGGMGSADISSPFSRGRMWSSMSNNNNNSATFDMTTMGRNSSIDEENDEPSMGSMMNTRRNTGRSGAGAGNFKRGMTTANEFQSGSSAMDVDNFNPWS